MHQYNQVKKIFFVVLGILAIGFMFVGAMRSYIHWKEDYYFGTIVSAGDRGFVIKEGNGKEFTVLINEKTIMRKGRETVISDLQVGDAVIVIGTFGGDGRVEARVIRFLDENRGVRGVSPYPVR
ncbi:MAG: hypothetical protein A2719_01880 [Candidatus Ryanbacteria bacterium RIFCSPHIGHO2_01_FULL_45_22]|uniref:Uncharacterized protein n=2 Tax=Candidatus Ryaniibacteriota TaxID=1817914 RepID=A0A1G2FZS6_9BACT|nr:MAG: hypothetical protein A2719_01880 [Candidatus Ryanbacteria bacterium RIFCSPHIGHO2_01_FULL_45_22]OGZ45371.1 MAG: hypothetical protein A3J54_03975 [Candidatus Ryanbacteria bacterium RIFCSPHIGHO2_02_FULL_45_13b]